MRIGPFARAAVVAFFVFATACRNPFGREYEYAEQVYLDTDGSAVVIVDASIPSLVALRNLPLDPSRRTRADREEIRALFESLGCRGARVGQPWVRHGRRFVQIRLDVERLTDLANCKPLAWSTYSFVRTETNIRYEQILGPAEPGDVGDVNWDGSEWVGFKLHAPSRILDHSMRRYEDNEPDTPGRGNILTWEQHLSDRMANRTISMWAVLGPQSILYRTLWLFGGAFAAAVLVLAALVWLAVRRARRRVQRDLTTSANH